MTKSANQEARFNQPYWIFNKLPNQNAAFSLHDYKVHLFCNVWQSYWNFKKSSNLNTVFWSHDFHFVYLGVAYQNDTHL